MTESVFMYLAFLIASGISSMIGIGGGVLYVPILLAFGFPFYQAAAISIFIIIHFGSGFFRVFYDKTH